MCLSHQYSTNPSLKAAYPHLQHAETDPPTSPTPPSSEETLLHCWPLWLIQTKMSGGIISAGFRRYTPLLLCQVLTFLRQIQMMDGWIRGYNGWEMIITALLSAVTFAGWVTRERAESLPAFSPLCPSVDAPPREQWLCHLGHLFPTWGSGPLGDHGIIVQGGRI